MVFVKNTALPNPLSINRFNQVTMSVQDVNATIAWYQKFLGFNLVQYQSFPEFQTIVAFIELNASESPIRLEIIQDYAAIFGIHRMDPPRHTTVLGVSQFSFVVPNIQQTISTLNLMGLQTFDYYESDPLQLYFVFVRDLNDNLVQFIQFFNPQINK